MTREWPKFQTIPHEMVVTDPDFCAQTQFHLVSGAGANYISCVADNKAFAAVQNSAGVHWAGEPDVR